MEIRKRTSAFIVLAAVIVAVVFACLAVSVMTLGEDTDCGSICQPAALIGNEELWVDCIKVCQEAME